MTCARLRLAQPWFPLMLLMPGMATVAIGCGGSHVAEDAGGGQDGGSMADAGSVDAARPDAPIGDAGAHDAGAEPDAGGPFDAGRPISCAAADAEEEICPEVLCDGPDLWHWDGERCRQISCGACRGDDCGLGSGTREACEADHAGCEPSLCRSTGGTWMWWALECAHLVCGFSPPVLCAFGQPVCDCGIGKSFVDGLGCQIDASCGAIDPLPVDRLCTSTGGTWGSTCCDSVCGEACARDCAADACTCGPNEIFDPVRGCRVGAECTERGLGDSCGTVARCGSGTICCDTCGGIGCSGMPTCRYPVCSPDPFIDTCGNDGRVP